MKKNTRNGLLALGLAAFAYWKYKLTPEQRQNVKNKVADAGNKLKENIPQEVKNFSDKVKSNVNRRTNKTEIEQPIV